jgi:ribonuclease Z
MGISTRETTKCNYVLFTHGHPDHVGSLVAHLGKRLLYGLAPAKVLGEPELLSGLKEMIRGAEHAQGGALPVEWIPISPGEQVALRPGLHIEAFRGVHTIPTQGYSLISTKKKLKRDYLDLPGEEIAKLRKEQGDALFHTIHENLFTCSGDALPELIDRVENMRTAQVLMMECSFLDDRKPVELARKGGHTHLDELLIRLPELQCSSLILTHFSQLYRPTEVREILASRLPEAWRDKTFPLTRNTRDHR